MVGDPVSLMARDERHGAFPEFTRLAAAGKFTVPVAGPFPLGQCAPPWS
jgi:hypothetical protein